MSKIAGLLFFLAGATILMGILTAEIFYPPGYSISLNMISNLGATRPPYSIITEPSATIFDTSIFIGGLLMVGATYFLQMVYKKKIFIFAAFCMGLGTLGVGIFPAFHAVIHPLVALLAFLGGGITAVLSTQILKGPFRYVAGVLGCITLLFLFMGTLVPQYIVPFLGAGGTERWVAYPEIMWLMGLGGCLMSVPIEKKSRR